MRTLVESIFSDINDIANNDTALIEQFLKDNYKIGASYTIKDGVVDVNGFVTVKNEDIKSLTNGLFRFGKVSGNFYCTGCPKLKSLKGSPKEVGEGFYCYECPKLTSLKGAPKEVGGGFDCDDCDKLTSLEGAPEKVGEDFSCSDCKKLKSLEGAPKKVSGDFYCVNCSNLVSLEGAPKEVGGSIYAFGCDKLTITDQDRKKYNLED